MNRYNRRNLVKIRRLAEEAMRSSPCTNIDGACETFSTILAEIDECLERNGQPYTGVDKYGFTASWSTRSPSVNAISKYCRSCNTFTDWKPAKAFSDHHDITKSYAQGEREFWTEYRDVLKCTKCGRSVSV